MSSGFSWKGRCNLQVNSLLSYYKKSFKVLETILVKSVLFIQVLGIRDANGEYKAKDWLGVTDF